MLITEVDIHVACAIIIRGQKIALSKRLKNADQGGLWEFPGGKIESGESPEACLIRELGEELGITPKTVRYMFQIAWNYNDKRIRFWVFEVAEFEGEPIGREGQVVQWFYKEELSQLQFPDANAPIIRTISLPRYCRIFSPEKSQSLSDWVSKSQMRSLIYFRGVAPSNDLKKAIDLALQHTHAIILNVDQLAYYRQGVGVHLRKSDLVVDAVARIKTLQNPWPITCGIRALTEKKEIEKWPFDAVFVSPVCETFSHRNIEPMGWINFEKIATEMNRPAFALGGIAPNDLLKVIKHFGFGVAGIRRF